MQRSLAAEILWLFFTNKCFFVCEETLL